MLFICSDCSCKVCDADREYFVIISSPAPFAPPPPSLFYSICTRIADRIQVKQSSIKLDHDHADTGRPFVLLIQQANYYPKAPLLPKVPAPWATKSWATISTQCLQLVKEQSYCSGIMLADFLGSVGIAGH